MNPGERASATSPVLHVLWEMDHGGAQRAVYQLLREQLKRGTEADVLVGSHGGFYGSLCAEAGAKVYELGQKGAVDIVSARAAGGILRQYPIVHFHDPEVALIRLATQQSRSRLFYTHRAGVFQYGFRRLARYKLAGRYFRKRFAGLSANTRQGAIAAASLFRLPRDQVLVTYNGLDFSLLNPTRERGEVLLELHGAERCSTLVGVTANLRGWKRIDRLVAAMVSLRDPLVGCLVIGNGPDRARLEQLTKTLGITDRIWFTGHKSNLGDYLQLLDIFVLPSGPEESFGNSAVEAMGVGIPTIVFADGGGLLEHVVDSRNGFIVSTIEELTQRIDDLSASATLRSNLGSQARIDVTARYDLGGMVERYDRLYQLGTQPVGRSLSDARVG